MPKTNMTVVAHILGLIFVVALAVVASFVLVGCAPDNKVTNEDEQIARLLRQLKEQREFSDSLAMQVDAVTAMAVQMSSDIAALTVAVQNLSTNDAAQDADLAVLHSLLLSARTSLASLQAQLNALAAQESATQVQVNGLLLQLATLQGMNNIVGILDPCNDAPGRIDEVLLQLSGGRLLASFSDNASGQNTRFSLIPNGNYVTTDGSNCHFTVVDGVATW